MNHLNVEVISRKEISYNSYLQRTYTISFFKNQFLFLIFFIALYLFFSQTLLSQENSFTHQTETYHRDYTFIFGFNYDVLNSSENFRTLIKIYSDTYYRKLAFKLEDSKTKSIIQFTWTFLGKWLTFLLPHEFGHWLRTHQVGGSFTFKQFAPPGIISDLKFHKNATIEDQSLALIGGFEANYLTARDVQLDFYRYGGL